MDTAADQRIARLIDAGESYRCERKRDLSRKEDKDNICRTICAFANDITQSEEVGVIALGVEDDGHPSGLPITDELEQKILNLRGEGKVVPIPSFATHKRLYRGHEILCIEVQPAISPPVKYDGRIWVRPGNTTRLAALEDERRLNEKRRIKDQPDDTQVLEHLSLAELQIDYFKYQYLPQVVASDILAANGRSTNEQLTSTKMAGFGMQDTLHPTILGILCLGFSPADAVPGAYVQFIRFSGSDITTGIVDEQTIHGHIIDVIQQTEAKFSAHNQNSIDFTSATTERRSSHYPKIAFEQLFRNAVMHRSYMGGNSPIRIYWYDNRIEITNPGGPFGMGIEDFGRPGLTGYRNPNLAGVLRDFGYVQRFGAGISVARKALQENGNPELELTPTENFVTIVMYK